MTRKISPLNNIPTILIIFGATGDLTRRKIIYALFNLFNQKQLPESFCVVGFSRRNIAGAGFRRFVKGILDKRENKRKNSIAKKNFINLFSYRQGMFDAVSDYRNLSGDLKTIDDEWGVCANKLFYVAAPPQFYEIIFKNLASSGLTKPCSQEEGWTRVIVEKPFGKDLKTANALEKLLSGLFREIQIYRIDHYLAKEMLQNILAFRFSNNLFEQSWNEDFIEKLEIRLWEKSGVENRGNFYDGLGALRDVGQNHLLQMLALITMDHPGDFSADLIRGKREEILKTLNAEGANGGIKSFRAQYRGYCKIPNVAKNSQTETYFKIGAFLSAPKWRRVPVILESGKRLKEQRKEIVVTFKHPTPCLCPEESHYKNKITIRFEPGERIIIQLWAKKPGFAFEIEKRNISFALKKSVDLKWRADEYEKLLLDCIAGNQTLFVSSAEVKAMWGFIDPILKLWKNNIPPLELYNQETNEPIFASKRISVIE